MKPGPSVTGNFQAWHCPQKSHGFNITYKHNYRQMLNSFCLHHLTFWHVSPDGACWVGPQTHVLQKVLPCLATLTSPTMSSPYYLSLSLIFFSYLFFLNPYGFQKKNFLGNLLTGFLKVCPHSALLSIFTSSILVILSYYFCPFLYRQ